MKRPKLTTSAHNKKQHCMIKKCRRFFIRGVSIIASASLGFVFASVSASAQHHDDKLLQDQIFLQKASRVFQEDKSLMDRNPLHGNASIIRQAGDNNRASTAQRRESGYGFGNLAYINQSGSNNNASIRQQGGNNLGVIVQQGDEHSADITQWGNNIAIAPQALIYQYGLNSNIAISQSSSAGRGISIEQHSYSGSARPVTIDTY